VSARYLRLEDGGLAIRKRREIHDRTGPAVVSMTPVIVDDDESEYLYEPEIRAYHEREAARRANRRAEAEAHSEDRSRECRAWAARERQRTVRRERFRRREGRADRIAAEFTAIDRFVADEANQRADRLARELETIDRGEEVPSWPDCQRGLYQGAYLDRSDAVWVRLIDRNGREIGGVSIVGDIGAQSHALDVAGQLLNIVDPEPAPARLQVTR
jgi:hypothetical protein